MDYNEIVLTEEETQAALLEGKKKKFFHLRSIERWEEEKQLSVDKHEEEKRLKRVAYQQARQASSGLKAQTHPEGC